MKTLYIIRREKSQPRTIGSLKRAAEARNIKTVEINADTVSTQNLPTLGKEDGIYRISTKKSAVEVEKQLLNEDVRSIYPSLEKGLHKPTSQQNHFSMKDAGIPVIPTLFQIPEEKDALLAAAESLGGFPTVLKTMGGQNGLGVMRLDSAFSLVSVLDVVRDLIPDLTMKKYIDHEEQARIVVVDGKVIGTHTNYPGNDFRTNAGPSESRKTLHKEYSDEIHQIAIDAVAALGRNYGGVDILFEKETGKPYVAEVNTPCFFPATEDHSGADIAGAILDLLCKGA